jgi:hypothetical protein
MNKLETQALLTLVSTLDQRKVSEDVVESWARILVNANPVHARIAVDEHFATKPETYLIVGHVVAGAKKQAEREASGVESQQRSLEESDWKADPCPICIHDVAIVRCDECCATLADEVSNLTGQRLFTWVDENLLKAVA